MQARATPLSPSEWKDMLRTAVRPAGLGAEGGAASAGPLAAEEETPPGAVLLDVRNAYEWDAGHFRGAARPLEASLFMPRERYMSDIQRLGSGHQRPGSQHHIVEERLPVVMCCDQTCAALCKACMGRA